MVERNPNRIKQSTENDSTIVFSHLVAKCFESKKVIAVPMTRGEYNSYRNFDIPNNENDDDEGYMIEHPDSAKQNDERHKGYISWLSKDVFDMLFVKSK